MKIRTKLSIAAILVFVALYTLAMALDMQSRKVSTSGTIKTVDLEIDVANISWGLIEPDETKTVTVNVRPNGTSPVTLTMNTTNWIPVNSSDFIYFSWNYTGATLQPDVWVPIEFQLYVLSEIQDIKAFSFDIIIVAESES